MPSPADRGRNGTTAKTAEHCEAPIGVEEATTANRGNRTRGSNAGIGFRIAHCDQRMALRSAIWSSLVRSKKCRTEKIRRSGNLGLGFASGGYTGCPTSLAWHQTSESGTRPRERLITRSDGQSTRVRKPRMKPHRSASTHRAQATRTGCTEGCMCSTPVNLAKPRSGRR